MHGFENIPPVTVIQLDTRRNSSLSSFVARGSWWPLLSDGSEFGSCLLGFYVCHYWFSCWPDMNIGTSIFTMTKIMSKLEENCFFFLKIEKK